MSSLESAIADLPEKTLLLLDDDGPLRNRLGRALESLVSNADVIDDQGRPRLTDPMFACSLSQVSGCYNGFSEEFSYGYQSSP